MVDKKKSVLVQEAEGVYKIIDAPEDDTIKISDYLKSIRELEDKK